MFLILPTHRKFIKLLRDRANKGSPVVLTIQDKDDFITLVRDTKQRLRRHQGLYRIMLKAMKRQREDIQPDDVHAILDNEAIKVFEKALSKAEWKSLRATLTGAYIVPLLRAYVKRMERKVAKD